MKVSTVYITYNLKGDRQYDKWNLTYPISITDLINTLKDFTVYVSAIRLNSIDIIVS